MVRHRRTATRLQPAARERPAGRCGGGSDRRSRGLRGRRLGVLGTRRRSTGGRGRRPDRVRRDRREDMADLLRRAQRDRPRQTHRLCRSVHGEGGGIYVAPADGGPGRRLTSAGPPTTTRVDTEPEWSPDGGSIAFVRWNMGTQAEPPTYEILEVPATGGDAVVIARLPAPTRGDADDNGDVRGLSW